MKLAGWMLSGSVVSSIAITALFGAEVKREVWLGMLGPLASALASWIVMERQHARQPEGLTALMIKAFAAKMIFFGGYITVFLGVGLVRPIPFVISFTGYFISLYVMEAIGLHRLQGVDLAAFSGAHRGQLRNG
jgi:hypothetical protein